MKQFRVTSDTIWTVDIVEKVRRDGPTYYAKVHDEYNEICAEFTGASTHRGALQLALGWLQRKGEVTEV